MDNDREPRHNRQGETGSGQRPGAGQGGADSHEGGTESSRSGGERGSQPPDSERRPGHSESDPQGQGGPQRDT
jgi:hypothetical protein